MRGNFPLAWTFHALQRWDERVPTDFVTIEKEMQTVKYATGSQMSQIRKAYAKHGSTRPISQGRVGKSVIVYYSTEHGVILVCNRDTIRKRDFITTVLYLLPKVYYHGTTEEAWIKIQESGVLHGVREKGNRFTYLTQFKEEAKRYGPVLLEVEYTPTEKYDNYQSGCWQLRTRKAISVRKHVKRIEA